jgi:putative hydrolase of the HAD superfamily
MDKSLMAGPLSPNGGDRIRAILLDYGGVIAEEGFHLGLQTMARRFGLDFEAFFHTATELIYSCGFVTGEADEQKYWELMRDQTGISGTDQELTGIILDRFVLRSSMLTAVRTLRDKGYLAVILSDQTDWLERLNRRDNFFPEFDAVFNSFHLGKTKRDPGIFPDILGKLGLKPRQALFVDDNAEHVGRAVKQGLHTHLFRDVTPFLADLHYRRLI